MITVNQQVIQQSVVRKGNFIQASNDNKINNNNRRVSDSDFDYHYDKSEKLQFPKSQQYDITEESEEFLSDDDHEPIDYNKQISFSATNTSINKENKDNMDDLISFEKVEVEHLVSPKVENSGLAKSFKNVFANLASDDVNNNNGGGIGAMLGYDDDNKFEFPTVDRYARHKAIPKGAEPPKMNNNGHMNGGRAKNAHKNGHHSINLKLCIIFSEFDFDQDISVNLQIFDEAMTVEQVIADGINKFSNVHPLKKLRSYQLKDYELRCIDDDDLEESDLDEDDLDPPLTRHAQISGFMDKKSAKTQFMVMCCIANISPKKPIKGVKFGDKLQIQYSESKEDSQHSDHHNHLEVVSEKDKRFKRKRAQTMEELEEQTKSLFIRVYIPGPINESSVVLSIERQDTTLKSLRDLFPMLNRKRKSHKFNTQYFDFYYRNKTKQYGAISNGTKLSDLIEKELIILPKILSSQSNDFNEQEAFQFELVKLANQVKQYKAYKIDKYRSSKKKAFLLEIDRYRFVKTSLETSTFSTKNKNHNKTPIPIQDIISVVVPDDNHKASNKSKFTITYSTPNKVNKTKTYQMNNNNERDETVSKLNFLCILRRLQG